jgi:FAD/FMN-containing dehydrogenase
MIDLSPMRSVRVDPEARTARADGGATWADFDAATQAFGLATTGGLISSTGVAGLTLGGGIGWLMGSYGLACDNLLSLDLVTAEGELITASAREHPELFWGLKGGGGNFGIATSFEFRLHPVGPLLAGVLFHPLARAREALIHFRDFLKDAPDELGALAGLVTSPAGEPVAALALVYNGPLEEGARVVQPLRDFGSPTQDTMGAMPYRAVQTLLDAGSPSGRRNYWKSSFLNDLPDAAIETLIERFAEARSPYCKLLIECLGGAVARVDRADTAFDHRHLPFNLLVLGAWEEPAADDDNIAWVRATWAAMQPHAAEGVYMNYLEAEGGIDRLQAAYGSENYRRLAALKASYDPENRFRVNQNVRPARAD